MNVNLENLFNQVQSLARSASTLLPAAGLVDKGIGIGKKILGVVDGLAEHVPPERQGELQNTRRALAEAVGIKADKTVDRLRGGGN